MKVTEYPITDEVTEASFSALKKIEASNGEFIFVDGRETYNNLIEYIDKRIDYHRYYVGIHLKNCKNKRYHLNHLEIWQRIKAQEEAKGGLNA